MIFASNNEDKIKQVKQFLNNKPVFGLIESGIDTDVVEDANSFKGNAVKKAREIYNLTLEEVVADDSGLCINAFKGWPGVLTHRFLGEQASEEARNAYILEKMKDVPLAKRKCVIICVIAYCDKTGKIKTFKGKFKSKIALKPQGENKFGFDEIVFANKQCTKTIADLTTEEKLKINARGLALTKLNKYLNKRR